MAPVVAVECKAGRQGTLCLVLTMRGGMPMIRLFPVW
jgi:hypothetical protein